VHLSRQTLLIEFTPSPEAFRKKAFHLKDKQPRRDILVKPKGVPTSDGTKQIGTGEAGNVGKRNVPRWTHGELKTDKGPPTGLHKLRSVGPLKKQGRVLASVELERTPLLFDHRSEAT